MGSGTSSLILGEDILCARLWYLRCRAGCRLALSQLFESSMVESAWLTLILISWDFFIEAISDSLSEGVDAGLTTVLGLLVSYSLIVTVRIKGSGTRVQFQTAILSWHPSSLLCGAFAYILLAWCWNIVIFMSSGPSVRSLMKDFARDSMVLSCQDRILCSAAYSSKVNIQKVRYNRHII